MKSPKRKNLSKGPHKHREDFVSGWFYPSGIGFWEVDCSMNPVFLLAVLAASFWLFLTYGRSASGLRIISKARLLSGSVALLGALLILSLASARGPVFSWLKALPPLSSLHVNSRFASALILPLSLGGCLILERLRNRFERFGSYVTTILLCSTMVFGLLYLPAATSIPMIHGLT